MPWRAQPPRLVSKLPLDRAEYGRLALAAAESTSRRHAADKIRRRNVSPTREVILLHKPMQKTHGAPELEFPVYSGQFRPGYETHSRVRVVGAYETRAACAWLCACSERRSYSNSM